VSLCVVLVRRVFFLLSCSRLPTTTSTSTAATHPQVYYVVVAMENEAGLVCAPSCAVGGVNVSSLLVPVSPPGSYAINVSVPANAAGPLAVAMPLMLSLMDPVTGVASFEDVALTPTPITVFALPPALVLVGGPGCAVPGPLVGFASITLCVACSYVNPSSNATVPCTNVKARYGERGVPPAQIPPGACCRALPTLNPCHLYAADEPRNLQ
jgi:hypothetical protein